MNVQVSQYASGDMLRKSIVFDKATPDVFYCPVDKPITFEKMYVRARPLKRLCEFDGQRVNTTVRVSLLSFIIIISYSFNISQG